MLDILILYTLTKYDCTIYRIQKVIETSFYPFLKPSLGAINPAVKRLLKLECITSLDFMSDGGMKSKRISITPFGQKYLRAQLLSFQFLTPTDFLINASMLLYCSDVLKNEELSEFKQNLLNQIIVYKNYVNNLFNSPYNMETKEQRKIWALSQDYISKIEALCQTK